MKVRGPVEVTRRKQIVHCKLLSTSRFDIQGIYRHDQKIISWTRDYVIVNLLRGHKV